MKEMKEKNNNDAKKEDKTTKSDKDEDTWFSDTSEAAQEIRKQEALEEMKAMGKTVEAIVAKAEKKKTEEPKDKTESAVQVLKAYLEKEHTVDEIAAELRRVQLSRELDDQTRVKVLLESLVPAVTEENIKAAIQVFSKHAKLLGKFTTDAPTQRLFLGCMEELLGLTQPSLIKYTAKILQVLYDADVLDEAAILAWYDSPPESSWLVKKDVAARVRKHAAKFAEWLKEADAEDWEV